MTIITTRLTVRPDGSISAATPLPAGEYEAEIAVPAPDAAAVPAEAEYPESYLADTAPNCTAYTHSRSPGHGICRSIAAIGSEDPLRPTLGGRGQGEVGQT